MDRQLNRRTRQFNERPIVKEQRSFIKGACYDLGASAVPSDGMFYATDVVAYANGAHGRTGNKLWAVLPAACYLDTALTASQSGTTVTIASGYTLTSADIGRWMEWSTGQAIPILSVNSNTFTTAVSATVASDAACRLRGDIMCDAWHPVVKKRLLHIDTRLFSLPWDCSSATQVQFIGNAPSSGTAGISEAKSAFRARDRFGIIANGSGIYRVELEQSVPHYYKLNTDLPQTKASDTTDDVYERRHLVSFTRLNGNEYGRDRITNGVPPVLHETGTIKRDTKGQDFFRVETSSAISSTSRAALTLYTSGVDASATHATIWTTADCGANGVDPVTGEANQVERYWWNMDVTLVKVFLGTTSGSPAVTLESNNSPFSQYDTGATISWADGAAGTSTISSVSTSLTNTATLAAAKTASSIAGAIGAAKVAKGSQSAYTFTAATTDYTFVAADIGKIIYFSDNDWDIILATPTTATATLSRSQTKTDVAAAWGVAATRVVSDGTSDTELKVRDGFLLPQRFLHAMPNGNLLALAPGFLFVAQAGGQDVYYCQTGESELLGYHHPGWQKFHLDDAVMGMSEFDGTIAVYCANGVAIVDLSSAQTMNREDTVEYKVVPLGWLPIRSIMSVKYITGIGCLDRNSFWQAQNDSGARFDLVLTNQRELRLFDGIRFGANQAGDRVMLKLQKLQAVSSGSFDRQGGLLLYGTETASS